LGTIIPLLSEPRCAVAEFREEISNATSGGNPMKNIGGAAKSPSTTQALGGFSFLRITVKFLTLIGDGHGT
jgi:hypothetical protein